MSKKEYEYVQFSPAYGGLEYWVIDYIEGVMYPLEHRPDVAFILYFGDPFDVDSYLRKQGYETNVETWDEDELLFWGEDV